jgi:hypothetical protein
LKGSRVRSDGFEHLVQGRRGTDGSAHRGGGGQQAHEDHSSNHWPKPFRFPALQFYYLMIVLVFLLRIQPGANAFLPPLRLVERQCALLTACLRTPPHTLHT